MSKLIVKIDINFEDIVTEYLKDREQDIKAIEKALMENSFNFIGQLGHKMNGSGGTYGFAEITKIGSEMETAAKEQNLETLNNLLLRLKSYLQNIEIVYTGEK